MLILILIYGNSMYFDVYLELHQKFEWLISFKIVIFAILLLLISVPIDFRLDIWESLKKGQIVATLIL